MKIATYEEVKDLCNHPEKLLIDVREPHELLETGSIPTSINIPRKYQLFTGFLVDFIDYFPWVIAVGGFLVNNWGL